MGMYDSIKIKKEIPLPEKLKSLNIDWKNHEFQTKDLENCLLNYWISEDGELFEHVVEREYVLYTEEERKGKNYRPWNIWKDVVEKGSREEKVEYHGTIKFYTYHELDDDTDFWVEFNAFFIYGNLDKVELIEYKEEKERKAYNKTWEEEFKKRQKHPWNKFKVYASYLGWKWFWKKISNILYKTSNLFSSLQRFVIRHML